MRISLSGPWMSGGRSAEGALLGLGTERWALDLEVVQVFEGLTTSFSTHV